MRCFLILRFFYPSLLGLTLQPGLNFLQLHLRLVPSLVNLFLLQALLLQEADPVTFDHLRKVMSIGAFTRI